jgi:hypothetical protein
VEPSVKVFLDLQDATRLKGLTAHNPACDVGRVPFAVMERQLVEPCPDACRRDLDANRMAKLYPRSGSATRVASRLE